MVEFVFTLEGSLAFEQPGFMTALPEAGSILYFSVRFRTMGSGKGLNRFGGRGNFASQNVLPAGREMAVFTKNCAMAGIFPTFNIGLHEMAGSTEIGGIAVVEEKPTKRSHKPKDQQQYDNAEAPG